VCAFICSKKTVGELVEDMEEVRCTDAAFGNLEMTFKLNKASTFYFFHAAEQILSEFLPNLVKIFVA